MSEINELVQQTITEYEAEYHRKLTEEEIEALYSFANELERRSYGFPETIQFMERTGVFEPEETKSDKQVA